MHRASTALNAAACLATYLTTYHYRRLLAFWVPLFFDSSAPERKATQFRPNRNATNGRAITAANRPTKPCAKIARYTKLQSRGMQFSDHTLTNQLMRLRSEKRYTFHHLLLQCSARPPAFAFRFTSGHLCPRFCF